MTSLKGSFALGYARNRRCQVESRVARPWNELGSMAVYNIGGGRPVPLLKFISCIETCLGQKAVMDFLPMQPGDVRHTEADVQALSEAVGYTPSTPIDEGIPRFVDWYRTYYQA